MGKINLLRVLVGGLLAGLVINVGETILNMFVLAADMESALAARNLPPVGNEAIASFVVMAFALGVAIVWLYAAIRTRFGPGVPTAILAGSVAWFLAYLYPATADAILGMFPDRVFTIGVSWGLGECLLAAIAGAWAYSED
jgi:hypothetical protein